MIEYTLPDFTDSMALNALFLDIQAHKPEFMLQDVRITSVYGNFPGCVLNGGRAQLSTQPYSTAQMEACFALLDRYGVKARLTLTNMLAEERHLDDPYFTQIMSVAQAHEVEAIVSTELVNSYVKAHYPKMPRILSTTCEILDVDTLNRATHAYDSVVLNYTKHRDAEFLSAIQQPQNIEVMVNEFCRVDCPLRMEHYAAISQDQIKGAHSEFTCAQAPTQELFSNILHHVPNHPVMLTNDDIRAMRDTYGITHFKLVGRGMPPTIVIDALMYYLIDPAHYQDLAAQLAGTTAA
jgi:collagenase-like PrtC family protease